MKVSSFALVPLVVLLHACTISEEDFPARVADAVCDRRDECTNELETEEERAACEANVAGLAELAVDLGELFGEEYSPSQGADCVSEIRAATCAEFNSVEVPCALFEDVETAE